MVKCVGPTRCLMRPCEWGRLTDNVGAYRFIDPALCTILAVLIIQKGPESPTMSDHNIYIYRVGQKSKLLILGEYVNKTEKTGKNGNKYEQLQRK